MTSESYHRSHVWRQGARPGAARDMLSGQAAPVLFGLSALLVIIFPWVWLPLLLAAALYAGWLSTQLLFPRLFWNECFNLIRGV